MNKVLLWHQTFHVWNPEKFWNYLDDTLGDMWTRHRLFPTKQLNKQTKKINVFLGWKNRLYSNWTRYASKNVEIYNLKGRLDVSLTWLKVDDVVEINKRSHHQTQTLNHARMADLKTSVSKLYVSVLNTEHCECIGERTAIFSTNFSLIGDVTEAAFGHWSTLWALPIINMVVCGCLTSDKTVLLENRNSWRSNGS